MTRTEQIKQWEKTITEIVSAYENLDAACHAASEAGCLDPNGALFASIWSAFEVMLEKIDVAGWIFWHLYENACGMKGFEASSGGGKMRPVKTAKDLASLIVDQEGES